MGEISVPFVIRLGHPDFANRRFPAIEIVEFCKIKNLPNYSQSIKPFIPVLDCVSILAENSMENQTGIFLSGIATRGS